MKNYIYVLLLTFACNVFADDLKVGIVDVNKILKEAPQTISANKKLEKEFSARTEKLKAKIKSIQADEKKYQKDSLTLSDSEKEKTEKNLQQRKIDIQRSERELREDMDLRRREEIGDLQERINETIDKLAATENFDLILYNGIAYASKKVDITSMIIKNLGGKAEVASDDKKNVKDEPKSK